MTKTEPHFQTWQTLGHRYNWAKHAECIMVHEGWNACCSLKLVAEVLSNMNLLRCLTKRKFSFINNTQYVYYAQIQTHIVSFSKHKQPKMHVFIRMLLQENILVFIFLWHTFGRNKMVPREGHLAIIYKEHLKYCTSVY